MARLSKKLKQLGFTSLWEILLLCSFITSSVVLYSLINFIQHARFETFMYDLGVIDQVLFKASKFYAPVSTVFNFPPLLWNRHLDLTFFLLTPFYFIWPDVRMYLILEPVIIVLGSFPIYLLAKEKLGKPLALAITFSYLFSLGVQFALDFPGHGDIRIATFLTYLFYFLLRDPSGQERSRPQKGDPQPPCPSGRRACWGRLRFLFKGNHRLVYMCALLTLLTKENSAFYLLFVGHFAAFILKKKKLGVGLIVLSSVFWLWFSKIFLPSQNIIYPFWEWYSHLKKNFSEIFLIVYPSVKIKTVFWLLASFGFLPLLSPALFSISVPMFAERFLANRAELWGLDLHYNILTMPVFVFSTIFGLEYLKRLFKIKGKSLAIFLSCYLVFWTLATTFWQKTFLTRIFDPRFYRIPSYLTATKKMISLIPDYATLEAQEDLFPHLSHRDRIYPLGKGGAVEFVTLDVNLFAALKGGKDKYIEKLLKNPDYGLVFCEEGAVLFERGKKDKVELCPKVREFLSVSGKPG